MTELQVTKRQKTDQGSSRPERWISGTWLDVLSDRIPDGVAYNLKYMHIRTSQWQALMEHIRRSKHWRQYRNVMTHLMCCRAHDENFYHERNPREDEDEYDIIFEGYSHLYYWPHADRSFIMQSDAKGVGFLTIRDGGWDSAFPRRPLNGEPKLCRWFSQPFYTD